jgi:FlaA1/EpsC-like NDP-sugar epimerase
MPNHDQSPVSDSSQTCLRTLMVGAGAAGRTLAASLLRSPDYGLVPIGFLDDDVQKRRLDRLPVLGPLWTLGSVIRTHRVEAVVVAIPSLPAERLHQLLEEAASVGARVRILPSFTAALQRDMRTDDLRHVRLHELLNREEVHVVRPTTQALIRGFRVLVTGAGGSIGSELCRQIRAFDPAALYMLDHDESNLHRLQLEVSGEALLDTDELVIADIRDRRRVDHVFETLKPDLVFHAAAHKHLPLLERHPCEGVKSNVLGTHHLVDAALKNGTERFILISTDKAAAPKSVLGATKRLAEQIVQWRSGGCTAIGSVRFGNVLGSRGSFLSVVRQQLAMGVPVTVTHPDVDRFFMTTEEAVGLVLEAGAMAEFGETFVLDMGSPVRIVDLVGNIASQLGAGVPNIRFTGLRPGEKLNETLFDDVETQVPTAHQKIWATHGTRMPGSFESTLRTLYEAADADSDIRVRRLLRQLVPEYTPPDPTPHSTSARALLATPYASGF